MSRRNSQWNGSYLWDIFSSAAITMIRMGYGEAKVPEDSEYEFMNTWFVNIWLPGGSPWPSS